MKFTAGQIRFLKAIYEDQGGIFHRRVVDPMFTARFVFPKAGNITFFIVGCNGHGARGFVLTEEGYAALKSACPRLPARTEALAS